MFTGTVFTAVSDTELLNCCWQLLLTMQDTSEIARLTNSDVRKPTAVLETSCKLTEFHHFTCSWWQPVTRSLSLCEYMKSKLIASLHRAAEKHPATDDIKFTRWEKEPTQTGLLSENLYRLLYDQVRAAVTSDNEQHKHTMSLAISTTVYYKQFVSIANDSQVQKNLK